MANQGRSRTVKRGTNMAGNTRNIYIEGNTARRLQEMPSRRYYPPQVPERRRPAQAQVPAGNAQRNRSLSTAARKNREKAMGMGRGFVIFLALVSVAILFFCIHYLQLKSEITASMKNVATLEAELTQLREDNDAYYSQVTSNIDMSRIKKIAIGRLGMKYPSEDQIKTYKSAASSYIRQYQDVPDSK